MTHAARIRPRYARLCAGALLLAALLLGCSTAPQIYEPTRPEHAAGQFVIPDDRAQIQIGRPSLVIDGLNHYLLSLPTKLILLDWRALDHRTPDETRQLMERYLEVNQMRSVRVRYNQYAPVDEFRRLLRNREVGAPYRATFGLLSVLRYTLLPDRLLAGLPLIGGGDHFNPFTNSIHVYSSDPAISLHEAGHAKDYLRQRWKGTWAAARIIPGVDLFEEQYASADAIRFLSCIEDRENELGAYRTLVPAYFTYISQYIPGGPIALIPAVAVGHVSGRRQARLRAQAMDGNEDLTAFGGLYTRRELQPAVCRSAEQTGVDLLDAVPPTPTPTPVPDGEPLQEPDGPP